MEWILVLVLTFSDSQVGQATVVTQISGHKTLEACLATLANAKKARTKQHPGVSENAAELSLWRSLCVEKGR